MKLRNKKKLMSCILCMALIVATAQFTTGCSEKNSPSGSNLEALDDDTQQAGTGSYSGENNVLGEGKTKFYFTVVDKEGNETGFEIHTDEETVGAALVGLELIAGENGQYGLYVKTVNGITADYDKDGVYWAFYVNGEYASTSVDATKIAEDEHYSFRVE